MLVRTNMERTDKIPNGIPENLVKSPSETKLLSKRNSR